ncbi:MAG: FkbM family methyltransferase [Acidobacteria bacterium]|nr:FkbM family methyltransferase [Acidobacteriota bacterium]
MSDVKATSSHQSTLLDRLAVLLALVGLLVGGYAVYGRIPHETVGLTVSGIIGEPVVIPEYLHARNVEFVTDYYGHRYKGDTHDLLDSHVLYYGAWEKWILFFLRDSAKALGNDAAVFVDVGANTGLHSLFMSSFVQTVHAIEPYPPALDRIADAIERNGLTNLVIHPIGIGAEDVTLPFFEPPNWNGSTGSFLQTMHTSNDGKGLQLQIVRGDDYFAAHGIPSFDIIKIDIEGYEPFALQGLHDEIEANRPLIVMELSIDPGSEVLFSSMEQLRAALPNGYKFFQFASFSRYTGSYEIQPLDVDFGRTAQYDIIAVPAEDADRIPKSADYSEGYLQLMEGVLPTA